MPEYIIGLAFSAALGLIGFGAGKLGKLDARIDELAVKVAETYVTKDELGRIEDKLDAVIWGRDRTIVGPRVGPCTNENHNLL